MKVITVERLTPKRIVWSSCGPLYLEDIKRYKKKKQKKNKRSK